MLTKKQHQLLIYVNDRIAETGVSPSFDEMKEALGLRSKSGIHRLIIALEERGYIRRLAHRARAIEVLRIPDQAVSAPSERGRPFPKDTDTTNVIRGNFAPPPSSQTSVEPSSIRLPLYGRIAAGTPIQALRDQSRTVDVPNALVGSGDFYALEVEGDSMIDAGIHNGDMVLIQRCDQAENGTIVVALVDNEEVTLKRLRRRGQSIALEPANPAYEVRICGPDQVRVQGKLVGLIRRY